MNESLNRQKPKLERSEEDSIKFYSYTENYSRSMKTFFNFILSLWKLIIHLMPWELGVVKFLEWTRVVNSNHFHVRMSHEEGEKILIDERHEKVAFSNIFDANNCIGGIAMH